MPCYEPDHFTKEEIERSNAIKDRIAKLESFICALCTELERDSALDVVFERAQQNSKINKQELYNFWIEHKKVDTAKILKKLKSEFTRTELEYIKTQVDKI